MTKRWYRRTSEEIYVYRMDKPSALFAGLPFIGRHFGYVGRTNNPARRDREHLVGGGRYNALPKDWADLRPRRYVLARKRRRSRLTTHFLEWFWIKALFPVYNVAMNRTNPRRIKPATARRQRLARQRYGVGARLLPAVTRLAVYATVLTVGWFMLAPR